MNQNEWRKGLNRWLSENTTFKDGGKTLICNECEEIIFGREKIVSLHFKGTRGGFDKTVRLTEPYCSKCGKGYLAPPFLDYSGKRTFSRENNY